MIRPIVKYPDPILIREAVDVSLDELSSPEFRQLMRDLEDTLASTSGYGLAAPQIGVPKKVALAVADGQAWTLINPVVFHEIGSSIGEEGCLSLPGFFGNVRRPQAVVIRGLRWNGLPEELTAAGITARVIMHEIDHLHGKMFIEYLPREKRNTIRRQVRILQAEGRW